MYFLIRGSDEPQTGQRYDSLFQLIVSYFIKQAFIQA
nr:MAG TPA: hypothetical protein [Caudoviricetes sp.]